MSSPNLTNENNLEIYEEELFEEHNGVYNGKWHIVTSEGFALPEGLEYLKNSLVKNIQNYKVNIFVNNIPLRITFDKTYSLLWNANIGNVILEISNDNERDPLLNFKKAPFPFLDELIVRDCHITIEALSDVILAGVWNGVSCKFSNNIFVSKNFDDLNHLEVYFKKNQESFSQRSVGRLDLRYCNFTPEEAEILKNKLENCGCRNLLI